MIRFLIDKYVTAGGKKLFACFFDIRRAFDTIPRNLLFYTLLKDYHIGGKYLHIIKEMYNTNQLFIKVSDGLCHPFITSLGLLQGETLCPLLFNIFINNISSIFDQSCDPVQMGGNDHSCLQWAMTYFASANQQQACKI